MSWVKLDDQFFFNRKIIKAGRNARDLYLASLAYCAGQLTDGFVPEEALPLLHTMAGIANDKQIVGKLLEVGLWELSDGRYRILDYIGCGFLGNPNTQELRKTSQYHRWRRAVLERDGWCCRKCKVVKTYLHAHHIRPWAPCEEARYDLDNGITLCPPCHVVIHREGRLCLGLR